MAIIVVDSSIDRLGPIQRLAKRLAIAPALAELMAIRLRFLEAETAQDGDLRSLSHEDLSKRLLGGMPEPAASLSPFALLAALVQGGLLAQDEHSLRVLPLGTAIPVINIVNVPDLGLAISPDPAPRLASREEEGGGGVLVGGSSPSLAMTEGISTSQQNMGDPPPYAPPPPSALRGLVPPTPEQLAESQVKLADRKAGRKRSKAGEVALSPELEKVFEHFEKHFPPEARLRNTLTELRGLILKACEKDGASPEQLIEAIDAYVEHVPAYTTTRRGDKRPGGFAPAPARWFEKGCWKPSEVARILLDARQPDSSPRGGFLNAQAADSTPFDAQNWKDDD